MEKFDGWLARVALLLLMVWAMWFTIKIGIKPEEIGQAVKNFNAGFGPDLPMPQK